MKDTYCINDNKNTYGKQEESGGEQEIGILSLWVQYSTQNMGLPSAKRKSDKTQIGLFIGGEVFHFGGDYDIIKTKICTNKSVQCVEKRCLSLNRVCRGG
ncbi:MAG TPA: hypothetical protein PLE84_09620 [Gemmiger qucibialis]|nr:hypothetical protein [Gemmiger qucibialis]